MWQDFEGVVLYARTHKEHDGLVKVFTKEFGTKMFFIRGLKKANHPMASQLLPLTKNQYVGRINEEGLSFLKEGQTLEFRRLLQTDYLQQAYGMYCAQLLDAALEEGEANPKLYDLFNQVLDNLANRHLSEVSMVSFQMTLLVEFGVGLDWKRCVVCGQYQAPFDFSVRLMGLLCKEHFNQDPYRLKLQAKTMHVAMMIANHQLDQIQSVTVSKQTMKQLRRLMDQIYQEYVGLRLKSKDFLDQMEEMEASIQRLKIQRQESSKEAEDTNREATTDDTSSTNDSSHTQK